MPMSVNAKIAVLGGGQLGRMLLQKAIDFNVEISIMDPDPNAPCKDITHDFRVGDLKNYDDVMDFGKDKDIISIEIEKVNTDALAELQKKGKKVFPQPEVISLIQDKRKQKQFYQDNGFPSSEFRLVENKEDVAKNSDFFPCFYKLAKDGYDGRGVHSVKTMEDLESAFDAPGLIEKAVDMHKEISVIVARNEKGEIKTFPLVEMVFHPTANLVDYLLAPAEIDKDIEEKAAQMAKDIIEKLDMVGLLAVEMFISNDGELLVNEMAPRTHNSGHQSIESNVTSQFEQHLRSIVNWPLGNTDLLNRSAMVNVLGADGYTGDAKYEGLDKIMSIDGLHLHLYGKKITKPFRKMGHITIVDNDRNSLLEKINFVKENFKVIA